MAKLKNNIGGHSYVVFNSQSLQEAAKELTDYDLLSVRYFSDITDYESGVSYGFYQVSNLFSDIKELADMAYDKTQITQFHIKERTRLEMSAEHFQVRLMVDGIKEKLENITEHLDLILGFTEQKLAEGEREW